MSNHILNQSIKLRAVSSQICFYNDQVDWVVDVACDYLIHQLSIDNYQTVLMLADKYLLGDLRGNIFRFLGVNITRLAKEKDFYLNFDLELLTKFLNEDVYIEAEEEFILDLVTKLVFIVCLLLLYYYCISVDFFLFGTSELKKILQTFKKREFFFKPRFV